MAIFHFNAKVITRSNGDNAVAAAAYRAGQRLLCLRTGMVFNYTRKREVSHREIRTPSNAPSWMLDRAQLWNRVEESESRKNSQLAREIEIALPIELSHRQHIELLQAFTDSQFVSQGMVADIAVHAKTGNPHAHILLTLREVDANGIGAKRRDWNDPALVSTWRQQWAQHCNQALVHAGVDTQIDHRSFAAQQLDRLPTIHVGRETPGNEYDCKERRAWNAFITARNELRRIKAEERQIRSQITALTSEIIDLHTSLSQALAERTAPIGFVVLGDSSASTAENNDARGLILSASTVPNPDPINTPYQTTKET